MAMFEGIQVSSCTFMTRSSTLRFALGYIIVLIYFGGLSLLLWSPALSSFRKLRYIPFPGTPVAVLVFSSLTKIIVKAMLLWHGAILATLQL